MVDFVGSPLSSQQERSWSLVRRDGPVYHAQLAVSMRGALDGGALRRALMAVVRHHEILRTVFVLTDELDVPLQAVGEDAETTWLELRAGTDWGLEGWLEEEWQAGPDGSTAPVLRAALLELSTDEHVLALTLPALCADAASLEIIYEELVRRYGDGENGEAPEDVQQYADYAAWQSDLLAGQDGGGGATDFWRERARLTPRPSSLPFERREGGLARAAQVRRVTLSLNAAERASVHEVARRHEAPPAEVLLAAWQALLWRLTGETEVTVGRVFDGRSFEELAGAVGPYSACLPVRLSFEGDTRFSLLLSHLVREVAAAAEHQHYFVAGAAGASGVAPALPYHFAYSAGMTARAAGGVTFSVNGRRVHAEPFRCGLYCAEAGAGLSVELCYDPRLYNDADARRLVETYRAFLLAASAEPEADAASYAIVGEAERHRLLSEFGRTEGRSVVPELCFHEIFEAQAAQGPDAVALVYEGRAFTYAELNARANRLAHHLRKRGVGPETTVALLLERSPQVIVAMLGVLKAGGAYVPLDPGQPGERIRLMLTGTRPAAVIAEQHLAGLAAKYAAPLVEVGDGALEGESDENPPSAATPGNLMYVLYTSGSSGAPKGVAVEHRQLVAYLDAVRERLQLPDGASYALVSTFAADLGNTVIFPALATGGTLHVVSHERVSDPEAAAAYFEANPVDCLKVVPGHLAALQSCSRPALLLPRLRLILGGEASRREWAERLKETNPMCAVINHYGPTETTVGVLTWELAGGDAEAKGETAATLPLGRPLANVRVYVLDRNMLPVPVGVSGELYVGGATVTRGYLHAPAHTAERFVPDSFSGEPGARLYKTGDRVSFLPDGNVEFLGRIDEQVKIRGFRVEPGEVETQLRLHTGVRDAVVVAREGTAGELRLAAYVVTAGEVPPQATGLRRHLEERLPEYMVPATFTTLGSLPRTPNGKIDRHALPAPAEEVTQFVAPRNAVEEALAAIWSEVLGVERLGVEHSFFELGGHSLLAMQLLSRLRATFQLELPLRVLFDAPTVAALAEALPAYETRPGQVERIAAILKQIESMPPEAVGELLRGARGESCTAHAGGAGGAEEASEMFGR